MSDIDEASVAPAEEEVTDLASACRRVLKNALAVDGVVRGLHECAKRLDADEAKYVFLSESCDEPSYKKLVKALCSEKNITPIEVPDSKKLGEWAGLCKIDKDGNARKVVGASCVVITDAGEDSDGLTFLEKNL